MENILQLQALAFFIFAASVSALHAPGCISSFSPQINYFPHAFLGKNEDFVISSGNSVLNNAHDFSVQYLRSTKLVYDSVANTSYALYQCGAPKPNLGALSNFHTSARVLSIPLSNVVLGSTVPIGFIELLGVLRSVKVANAYYTVSPCAQKLLQAGAISPYNFSAVYTQPWIAASLSYPPAPNVVSFDATRVLLPLKRAEWIKYLALFFNAEVRAAQVYSKIEASYNCLKASGAKAAATKGKSPVVAWLSYYGGSWTISKAGYKLQFVIDASGTNLDASLLTQYNVSVPESILAFKNALKSVDVVIDETYLPSGPSSYGIQNFTAKANISNSEHTDFPFLATSNVWNLYGRSTGAPFFGLDWFEGAVAQPQLVLNDLISILHLPTTASPSTTYFHNIAKGKLSPAVTPSACKRNPYSALEPTIPCAPKFPAVRACLLKHRSTRHAITHCA